MAKKVVLIGHCGPDSSYLRLAVARAQRDAQVAMIDDQHELEQAIQDGVDLLLFNRVLNYGFSEDDGTVVIAKLRARFPELKMMLVSNYAEAQAQAVAAGALPGFGKRDIGTEKVTTLIRDALAGTPLRKAE